MKRILIVEVNWVGDVLFSTPFIKAVRDAYPDSHIACLLHPRTREMLESNPRVNEIIIYDEEGLHRGFLGKLRLVRELKKRNFNTAFILHRSFTKAMLTYLAGIGERLGYATKLRRWILTKAIDEPVGDIHKVEYFLRLASAAGIQAGSRSYEFFIGDAAKGHVGKFLANAGLGEDERFVVINPGGNWDPKRWPKENFAKLSDLIAERFKVRIAITGSKKDIALARDIQNLMKARPVIAAGKTTMGELAAILERAVLVISNDSGPMHLAVAVGAKVVALFGPTSPDITGPYGGGNYMVISKNDRCEMPCYNKDCSINSCMSAITVDDVMREVEKALG